MTYKRTVDKAEIPICNIMGVNIAAINMKWLLDYLEVLWLYQMVGHFLR